MKAYLHTTYGPPEDLKLTDIPVPVPGGYDILIKIHATTVNRTDNGFLRAEPFIARFFTGLLKPKNRTLGSEFSGQVVSVGTNVSLFKVGDRVFGFSEFGAHAEYISMAEHGTLATIPGDMPFSEAAPLTEGAHYALNNIQRANIRSGQHILLYGATGAIGSAALQIIKAIGAEVTAVCNTKNIDLIQSLGADRVIDYTAEDFTKTDKKYDVVFDAVGKCSFKRCKPLLKERGIFLSTDLGPYAQNPFLAIFTKFSQGKRVLFPIPVLDKEMIHYLKDLAQSGKFKPVIERTYTFEQLPEAFNYVHTGQKTGNLVVMIGEADKT